MATNTVPALPVPLADLHKHLARNPDTPVTQLFEPYRKYEAHLREAFAQDPSNELLKDPHVNVLPLFTEDTATLNMRARNLAAESKEERSRYIMPLPKELRRPNGSPATVRDLKEFRRNFNVFSESSLVELDWSNVVAAGSSVVNCLLPVPDEYNRNKRTLREFYHEKFSPASDVDLFLYGLTEEQAIEKIKDIEARVRDSLLTETTTVRTKNAITICSQYPTRHIQIVLRIYNSVSEILTGFDIDCSGAAYDGRQVYCTPRALQSYLTQINHIDLTRRSPSYENRLSKYSHRGFEVYWPDLDRSRIDPTIFERSFQRTLGLARLLVLERLPTQGARDTYTDQRRKERGRPAIDRYSRNVNKLWGNIKDEHEDEVADWALEDEISNYHTFTIPYGTKYHAKKIEKLCYTRDLLLNAEWNQKKDREVYLHRHPAFFGRVEDVVNDCCGFCPVPTTDQEKEVAAEEEKYFVSGKISFLKDDPGRQAIGSFNPLTDDDWTEMAYVGNTARLCQAIVDGDAEHVADWLAQEGVDPNTRDYTGRTPLHLAVMTSTPEIVRLLVDAGARLVARLADGRTALHLAASRGNVEIVQILMNKSVANEAEHEEKEEKRRKENAANKSEEDKMDVDGEKDEEGNDEGEKGENGDSDGEMIDGEDSDDEGRTTTSGFVKVGKDAATTDELALEEADEEPDFYDVNVIAWDTPCSALHFAIIEGHTEVVKTLCQEYGADVLLPVKFLNSNKTPYGALLTLVLALVLPVAKAKEMAKTLLSLGATSAQADLNGVTAFHRYVEENAESLLATLWEHDAVGTKTAINHISMRDIYSTAETALGIAVKKGNLALVLQLLDHGAVPQIDFESWLKSAKQSAVIERNLGHLENNKKMYNEMTEQPLILAINSSNPASALELLKAGADPNVVTMESHKQMGRSWVTVVNGESALDLVNSYLVRLKEFIDKKSETPKAPELRDDLDSWLTQYQEGTYQHTTASTQIAELKKVQEGQVKQYAKKLAETKEPVGTAEKRVAILEAIVTLAKIKEALLEKGAKTFGELFPLYKAPAPLPDRHFNYRTPVTIEQPKADPTKFLFSFKNVTDVTDSRQPAYVSLFEAAWSGDLETIKKLCLTSWDEENAQAPLKIAVYDAKGNSPFSLAYFRGHHEVAKAILEIAHAQYTPMEKPEAEYRMHTDAAYESDCSMDYSDEESVCSDGSRPDIYRHIVGGQFTIENIGEVSMKVKSHTKPSELLERSYPKPGVDGRAYALISRAVYDNDMQALKFVLGLAERFSSQKPDGTTEDKPGVYAFPDSVFKFAIKLGRTELLAEIIKRTGAGLPLENLVKNTGVEIAEKPTYYQGLTVYGKKRKDWATQGRNSAPGSRGLESSPLLLAAQAAQIASVEWFLSDAPLRHYLAFCKSKAAREDARIKHLGQSKGGFEGAISKWLTDNSDLAIHAAVYAVPNQKTTDLAEYLIKVRPESIDAKDANGATPLMGACRLGRVEIAKLLIEAGADQKTKDGNWGNLLHAALRWKPTREQLKPLLDLLDRDLLVRMLKERNNLKIEGHTPLHTWLLDFTQYSNTYAYKSLADAAAVFNLVAELSPEVTRQALRMLDGAGNTPLHSLLMGDTEHALVRLILDFEPSLLLVENAVGRTPAELIHEKFISSKIKVDNPSNSYYYRYQNSNITNTFSARNLHTADPKVFVEQGKCARNAAKHAELNLAKTFFLCKEFMSKMGANPKRSLVSLHAANVVAQRLGKVYERWRYRFNLGNDLAQGVEELAVSDDGADDEAGGAPAAPAKQARDEHIISQNYIYVSNSWLEPGKKEKVWVTPTCQSCHRFHEWGAPLQRRDSIVPVVVPA
ncbi:hypothetical protein B0T21DRAFT_394537 [Apiosordaria backusii]|uniref:Ankyrin repeat protein n=1 Tax=Apiosordaria backusii TaxID=314023 RepID=A0AA40B7R7_9PEZI|nr:hypothetical protein B0T21DRAFT_394537 [Apiosordaria backusii]